MNICQHTSLRQQGLTLIELLIAMMLSAFLLAGVVQSFLSARQTYRVEEGLSRLIENARYAIEFIDQDLRMAGFGGCKGQLAFLDDESSNDLNHLTTSYLTKFGTTLEGFEAISSTSWSPTLDPSFTTPARGDVITIRRADESGHDVTVDVLPNPTDVITLNDTSDLVVNDNVLIADCSQAEVFQITALSGNTITHGGVTFSPPPPTHQYMAMKSEVFPVHTTSYYVQIPNGADIPSLYRKIDNDTQALIEGVEDLQIEYGVDSDPTQDYVANYYVAANSVADMKKVVSVRIRMLVATPNDNVTAEVMPFSFAGTDYNDHRIRHVFTSTIALRNRIN